MNLVEHIANVTAAIIAGVAILSAILYLPWRVRDAYKQTFIALARAVESREPYLIGHAERTARYAVLMARWCGMSPWATKHLEYAALMHGIGKVGVPYGLLNNPDPLYDGPSSISATDRFVMRDYVRVGAAIMDAVPALHPAADIVRFHHEYYDGSGYPFGRYGRGIPFRAQMLCVASEYVAMTAPRLYRQGVSLTSEQAIAHLWHDAGRRYHRGAVTLFVIAKRGDDFWLRAKQRTRRWYQTGLAVLPRRAF